MCWSNATKSNATLVTFRPALRSACQHPPFPRPRLDATALNWAYVAPNVMLGGVAPPDPPSASVAFPLVSDLRQPMRESAALVTWCKSPGQRAISESVELGGIEPPSIRC